MRKTKRSELLAIYLPGSEQEYHVHSDIFGSSPLGHFQQLAEGEACDFSAVEYRLAKRFILLKLVKKSLHSKEVARLLSLRNVSEQCSERLIAELQQAGYIDDEGWLAAFVATQKRRCNGPRVIGQKLYQRGFTGGDIEEQPVQLSEQEQKEAIWQLVTGRYKQVDLTDRKARQRLLAALMRKGFPFDLIREVLQKRAAVEIDV